MESAVKYNVCVTSRMSGCDAIVNVNFASREEALAKGEKMALIHDYNDVWVSIVGGPTIKFYDRDRGNKNGAI